MLMSQSGLLKAYYWSIYTPGKLVWCQTHKEKSGYYDSVVAMWLSSSSSSGAMLNSVGDHVLPYSTVPCCFQDFNHLACSQPVGESIGHLLSLFPSAAFSFHHSCCCEMFQLFPCHYMTKECCLPCPNFVYKCSRCKGFFQYCVIWLLSHPWYFHHSSQEPHFYCL